MKKFPVLLVVAGLLQIGGAQGQAIRPGDAKSLDGEWQAVEWQFAGQKRTSEAVTRWIFRGDELIEFHFASGYDMFRPSRRKVTLDSSQSPAQIDITITFFDQKSKDQNLRGVWSLEGDRLLVCVNPGEKRAAELTTSEGDGNVLYVFRRVGTDPSVTLEFAAIRQDFDREYQAWSSARQNAKTTDDRKQIDARLKPRPELFAQRYSVFAQAHPDGFAGLSALCWAAINAPTAESGEKAIATLEDGRLGSVSLSDLRRALNVGQTPMSAKPKPLVPFVMATVKQRLDDPEAAHMLAWICSVYFGDDSAEAPAPFTEAADLIVSRFAASPDIASFCECLGFVTGSPLWAGRFEKHLRTILEQNSHPMVRSRAAFALASVVQTAGQEHQNEAERLYEQFSADFRDLPKNSGDMALQQLLDRAAAQIDEIQNRGIGRQVPDLAGEDVDGRPMKLSDFRGKVVLLSFWATWCAPCVRMIPDEKSLVQRLDAKPFVLIGVNGDENPDDLKKGIEKYGITWRSFKDKQPASRTISHEWKINGWPTIYLIDKSGIVRHRWTDAVPGPILEREIDQLLDR